MYSSPICLLLCVVLTINTSYVNGEDAPTYDSGALNSDGSTEPIQIDEALIPIPVSDGQNIQSELIIDNVNDDDPSEVAPDKDYEDQLTTGNQTEMAVPPSLSDLGRGFDSRAKILSRISSILAMSQSTVNTRYDHKEFSARIQNYACHCFPQDETGNTIGGKGAVVNDVDKLCKQLYDCHSCIQGEECLNPDFDRYDFSVVPSGQIDCTQEGSRKADQNKLKCKQAMCECDRDFAVKLGAVWKDEKFDEQIWFNAKNIQKQKKLGKTMKKYSAVCKKKSNLPNNHECCGRALYNPIMSDCCMNDVVSIGSC